MHRILLLHFLAVLFVGCSGSGQEPVRVACSANAVEAIREIAFEFSQETGIEVHVIPGSSGNLTAQITQGAPYDVFVSANLTYPEQVAASGLVKSDVRVYALGNLVVRSRKNLPARGLQELASDTYQRIAIANPSFAPYGIAARQVIDNSGLSEVLEKKLVYGESITQVDQFVESGAVDAAFTSKSSVLYAGRSPDLEWFEVNPGLHDPIRQGAVLLDNPKGSSPGSTEFFEYLFGDTGQEILQKFGYALPDTDER